MKFEVTVTVDREGLKQVIDTLPERHWAFTAKRVEGGTRSDFPSETVISAIMRRPKPKKVRRSKVQEAIIEMLGQGPLTTAEIRAGMDRFNLSPASISALTPMRAEGRIVSAAEGKWALAGA